MLKGLGELSRRMGEPPETPRRDGSYRGREIGGATIRTIEHGLPLGQLLLPALVLASVKIHPPQIKLSMIPGHSWASRSKQHPRVRGDGHHPVAIGQRRLLRFLPALAHGPKKNRISQERCCVSASGPTSPP